MWAENTIAEAVPLLAPPRWQKVTKVFRLWAVVVSWDFTTVIAGSEGIALLTQNSSLSVMAGCRSSPAGLYGQHSGRHCSGHDARLMTGPAARLSESRAPYPAQGRKCPSLVQPFRRGGSCPPSGRGPRRGPAPFAGPRDGLPPFGAPGFPRPFGGPSGAPGRVKRREGSRASAGTSPADFRAGPSGRPLSLYGPGLRAFS